MPWQSLCTRAQRSCRALQSSWLVPSRLSADYVGQQLRKTSLEVAPNPIPTGRSRGDLCSLPKTHLHFKECPGLTAPGCGKAPHLELQADATNSCWLILEALFCKLQSSTEANPSFETKVHPSTPGAQLPNLPMNVAFHQAMPVLTGVPLEGSKASALDPTGNCRSGKLQGILQLLSGICNSAETTTRVGILVSRTAACSWHLLRNSHNRSAIQER